MTNYSKFDPTRVNSRGFSIYDPASAYDWVPTIERNFLSLEIRAERLGFGSVAEMKEKYNFDANGQYLGVTK